MPRLSRDIFKHLLRDVDGVELVGERDAVDDLASVVREVRADIVIVDGESDATSVATFLRDYTRLKVLAVEAAGDSASVHEFSPHRSYVGELTRETVLRAFEGRPA
jgi:hypothetical protein